MVQEPGVAQTEHDSTPDPVTRRLLESEDVRRALETATADVLAGVRGIPWEDFRQRYPEMRDPHAG